LEPRCPPKLAEFLLTLCARKEHQKAALGDLNEKFERNCVQGGRARAIRLYWAEAVQSLLPLFVRAVGRFVKPSSPRSNATCCNFVAETLPPVHEIGTPAAPW